MGKRERNFQYVARVRMDLCAEMPCPHWYGGRVFDSPFAHWRWQVRSGELSSEAPRG